MNNITNEIRKKYYSENSFFYDEILNECILDSFFELIKKEKLFYNIEKNQIFFEEQNNISTIQHNIFFNDKKKFVDYICKSILSLLETKLGKNPNELSIINMDQIKEKNEIKINQEIKQEIIERDKENINDIIIQETKIKFELANKVLDLLLEEIVIILENIQTSRHILDINKEKDFYQNDYNLHGKDNDYYGDFEDDLINY